MDLRSGQWTSEEVSFATRLIDEFRNGSLQIPDGTSMRGFLAEKLGCVPKRVSKKYENTNYNGRLSYTRNKSLSAEKCVRVRLELEKLERAFRQSVDEAAAEKKEAAATAEDRKPKAKAVVAEPPRTEPDQQEPQLKAAPPKAQTKPPPQQSLGESGSAHDSQRLRAARYLQSVSAVAAEVRSSDPAAALMTRRAAVPKEATAAGGNNRITAAATTSTTTAANEELLKLLAARQRLLQQRNLLAPPPQPPSLPNNDASVLALARTGATGASLASSLSASRATERYNGELLSSLTSSLQRQPSHLLAAAAARPPPPPPQPASAPNGTTSLDRLRFLQQLDLEQKKQRILSNAKATQRWRNGFERQARVLAASRLRDSEKGKSASLPSTSSVSTTPLPRTLYPAGLSPEELLKLATVKGTTTNTRACNALGTAAADALTAMAAQTATTGVAAKRKEPPTLLLPDPKRPRYY